MTADLVDWLRAQLDTDERIARAATLGPWVQSGIGDYGWTVDFGRPGSGVETADTEQGLADADFIATHDPARVLREIDVKRQLVALHCVVGGWEDENGTDLGDGCQECGYSMEYGDRGGWCETVRLLALPYSDRPGYREEWRP